MATSRVNNLDGNYDVMNKINKAEHDVIISILLKATKECSVLKVNLAKEGTSHTIVTGNRKLGPLQVIENWPKLALFKIIESW